MIKTSRKYARSDEIVTSIDRAFARGRLAFIPYVMAGDPDMETSELLIETLAGSGAAVMEIGVPYGDPLADGPTVAAAGARALANAVGIEQVFTLVGFAARQCGVPAIIFSYFNPILQYGIEAFARDAARAGAAGVIVPDTSLEEGGELRAALRDGGLATPLLVAPSTPLDRAARIAREASGFVYVVSRSGVTGEADAPDYAPLRSQLRALRTVTEKPLAVGFGISSARDIRALEGAADGAIVGSALIAACEGARGREAAKRAGALAQRLFES